MRTPVNQPPRRCIPAAAVGDGGGVPTSAPGRQARTAVALLGFCTFLNLYTTQPLLPLLQATFHATPKAVSMTVGATVVAIALSAPWLGLMADATGRKRVIIASLLGLALPTGLVATATDLTHLVGWRFVQGLFIPGVMATTMAYISEEFPASEAGSAMAVYVTGTVVGGFCGRWLAGWAGAHWHWRWAFLVLSTATFLGGLVAWRQLPQSRRFVRQAEFRGALRGLWKHLGNTQLLATYAVGFQVLFSLVAVFTYVNFYLAAPPFHLGSSALGSVFLVYLIGAAVTPAAGRMIDRWGNRRTLTWALTLSASGVLLTLPKHLGWVMLGLTLCCTGVFFSQAAAAGQVGRVAGQAKSSASGLYVSFYYLGGGIGSVVPGLIWEQGGWPICVILVVFLQLLTVLFARSIWQDRQADTAARVGRGGSGSATPAG